VETNKRQKDNDAAQVGQNKENPALDSGIENRGKERIQQENYDQKNIGGLEFKLEKTDMPFPHQTIVRSLRLCFIILRWIS